MDPLVGYALVIVAGMAVLANFRLDWLQSKVEKLERDLKYLEDL